MSLHDIQTRVHVGKDKVNSFGGYNYRTAEGILAAAKAALPDGATIVVTDDLVERAGQIFIKATAEIKFADGVSVTADGFALHPLTKKGMDPSQITGSASSYARKYALAGLLALDDGSVDPDGAKEPYEPAPKEGPPKVSTTQCREIADKMIAAMRGAQQYGQWKAITGDKKFEADMAFLVNAAEPMSLEVQKAIDEAKLRVDPAGQAA